MFDRVWHGDEVMAGALSKTKNKLELIWSIPANSSRSLMQIYFQYQYCCLLDRCLFLLFERKQKKSNPVERNMKKKLGKTSWNTIQTYCNSVKLGKTYEEPLRPAQFEADQRKLGKTR